jgi:hypothetical protein
MPESLKGVKVTNGETPTEPMKEPIYKDKLVDGLNEYVIQDLSALAGRPYDSGKFLFSISSFMLVATLTLVTGFKGLYLFCLIAILPLSVSFIYSFKLTLAVVQRDKGDTKEKLEKVTGNEIDIDNSIYKEYLKKNNWLAHNIKCWKVCMAFFAVLLVITVAVATYFTSDEEKNKDAMQFQQLSDINASINKVAIEIANLSLKIKEPEQNYSTKHLNELVIQLSTQVENNHKFIQKEFDLTREHLDSHLLILNKEPNSDK